MFHFFARLGRHKNAKNVMPTVVCLSSLTYLGVHHYGHNLITKIFSAYDDSGQKERILPDLQKLIVNVYDEVQTDFNKPLLDNKLFFQKPPPIKWYLSSSLEPITYGMTETRTGLLIGLPHYYNCNKEEELPSSLLEFRSIRLFKSDSKTQQGDKENSSEEASLQQLMDPTLTKVESRKVDPENPAAKSFLESMILSDKAKKFSIARELFYGDGYHPISVALAIGLSGVLGVSLGRLSVLLSGVRHAHLSQRLPFYALAGYVTYVVNRLIIDGLQDGHDKKSDIRAMSLGEDYRLGAVEYFSKNIQRNKALRELLEGKKTVYDENGDRLKKYYQISSHSLTKRLNDAEKFQPSVEQETKSDTNNSN